MAKVDEWNSSNPSNLVGPHSDQQEGNSTNSITYTHGSSESYTFQWGELTNNRQSLLDAVWIKGYNGNSNGYYYRIVPQLNSTIKPAWELRRTNAQSHNYVEAVSGRNQ
jgi:hypothetical protein